MIDRRDISYTQGTPNSPGVGGVLLRTPQTVTTPSGGTVSTKWDIPGQPVAQTEAEREATQIQPVNIIQKAGEMVQWRGLSPSMVGDFWNLLLGSAEHQQQISLGYLGGMGAVIPSLFPSPSQIKDVPIVDFPGSETPGLPALDTAFPGAGDFISNVFNLPGGGGSGGGGLFPDISGWGKYVLIAGLAIAGVYLAGKVITK